MLASALAAMTDDDIAQGTANFQRDRPAQAAPGCPQRLCSLIDHDATPPLS